MKYPVKHICRHRIQYSRRHIRQTFTAFIALISMVSLLATQMAVAAHLCPVMVAAMAKPVSANDSVTTVTALTAIKTITALTAVAIDSDANVNADADKALLLPPCHTQGKSPTDSPTDSGSSPALCQQHCTADHRIVGDANFQAPIAFIAAHEIMLVPLVDMADHASDLPYNTIPIGLQHPVKPAPTLAFGQLRI